MRMGRVGIALAALAAICAALALAKLRPLWRNFDTAHVRLTFAEQPDSAAARLDAILLRHLAHLGYIRSFDHVFAAGTRRLQVSRPLWLDRCEVRQADFYTFAQWRPFHPDLAIAAPRQPHDWQHFSNTRDHAISGRLDAPANGLTWFDAYAYCRAADGRLPSAAEWIAAAVGVQGRLFPWGDVFDPKPWAYLDPLLNAARQCGANPETNTPAGLADMGHNVSEWAAGDGGEALVMGGNAYNAPRELHSLAVLYRRAPHRYRSPYLGFRCIYDAEPARTPWRTAADAVLLPPGDYAVGIPQGARIPSLVAHLPPERLALVRRLFERGDRAAAADLHFTVREITRREYAAFLADPFVLAGFHAEPNQPAQHSHRPPDWRKQMAQPQLPVVNVDWWSAYAFAAWAGGRLPAAEEWEGAASDQGRRLYPWGNAFEGAQPVTGERRARGPEPASATNGDVTPQGLLAMGGNVSEWTRSVSTASGGYAMVVKGGNYLLPGAQTARFDHSNHVSPHYRSPTLGFRVVFARPR